jgi:hypothetical protein
MQTRFYTAHKSTMTIRNNDPVCGKLICKQASDPRDGAAGCEYESVRDGVIWRYKLLQVGSIFVK